MCLRFKINFNQNIILSSLKKIKKGFAGHFFTIIIDKHLNRSLGKLLITASDNCTCFRKGNMKLCLEEPIVLLQFEVMQCYVIQWSLALGFIYPSACCWHIGQLANSSATTVTFPRAIFTGSVPSAIRQGSVDLWQVWPRAEDRTAAVSHATSHRPAGPRIRSFVTGT